MSGGTRKPTPAEVKKAAARKGQMQPKPKSKGRKA